MVKNFIIFANLVTMLFFNFFGNNVSITINAPETVVAGEEFLVEVIINKGTVSDFSRFQQELPFGFTATSVENAGGSFTFQNQKVKLIWYKGGLPTTEEFKISYKVKVNPTLVGTVMLDGEFSYLDEEGKKKATLETPITLSVTGGTEQIQQPGGIPSQGGAVASNVKCYRQKPYADASGNIIINMLVEKGSENRYGKIQESIPAGFSAEAITEGNDVIFQFKDKEAKFLWMTLPAQQSYVVSYKLIPDSGFTVANLTDLKGVFSYVDKNETTLNVDVIQTEVNYGDPAFIAGLKKTPVVAENKTTNNGGANKTNGQGTKIDSKKTTEGTTASNETTKKSTSGSNSGKSTSSNTNKKSNGTSNENATASSNKKSGSGKSSKSVRNDEFTDSETAVVSDPETGLNYKIQIGAYRRNLKPSYFKTQKVDEPVKKTIHEGLHKYLIGKYDKYAEATSKKKEVWGSTAVKDAFVTAYNNGNRITVQEALMLSNQTAMR